LVASQVYKLYNNEKTIRTLYPWSGPIPVIQVSGKPYELGRQHARAASERIRKNVSDTWTFLEKFLGCSKSDLNADLKAYDEKIRQCHPSFANEIEGLADGASVSYDDIVLLSSHINILHSRGGLKGLEGLLCSSFTAWGNATRNGSVVIGHNDDGVRFTDQFLVLLDAVPSEGFRFACPLVPGYLGYHTIVNNSGFCVVGNALENGPRENEIRVGIPMWVIFRYLGQFVSNVKDGIEFLRKVDNGIAGSFLLADKCGDSVIFHLTPNANAVIRPKRKDQNFLTLTNHCLVTELQQHLQLRPRPSSTYFRYSSITKAVKEKVGKIDLDTGSEIMSTHYDTSIGKENPSGNTPCRHYEFEGKFAGTCRSAVVDLGKKRLKMIVGLGNPCTATWVEVSMQYSSTRTGSAG
jgi:isopenicillin-N N-acyltransferase like protein